MEILFYIYLFCNIFMIGISLITQFVTYPSFQSINPEIFSNFHKIYAQKMLFIVGPIMTIEFLSVVVLLFINNDFHFMVQFIFVFLIWILTFFLIVPIHNELEKHYDKSLNNKLIKLNGYRTFLWFVKFIFLLIII